MEGGSTVHCFALAFSDAFVFADEEVEFLVWVGERADLVFFVYCIACLYQHFDGLEAMSD